MFSAETASMCRSLRDDNEFRAAARQSAKHICGSNIGVLLWRGDKTQLHWVQGKLTQTKIKLIISVIEKYR